MNELKAEERYIALFQGKSLYRVISNDYLSGVSWTLEETSFILAYLSLT